MYRQQNFSNFEKNKKTNQKDDKYFAITLAIYSTHHLIGTGREQDKCPN